MDTATESIVIRTRPFSETSLIVHWMTREHGRIATLAKGARRPRSPFRGKLDLLYVADIAFVRSRRSDLHSLREVRLRENWLGPNPDWNRMRHTAYAVRLIEKVTERDSPVPEIDALFREFLASASNPLPVEPTIVLAFETRLLQELGLLPARRIPESGFSATIERWLHTCGKPSSAIDLKAWSGHSVAEVNRFLFSILADQQMLLLNQRKPIVPFPA